MTFTVLLCTDGSELSSSALAAGWQLMAPDANPVVVIVAHTPDPMALEGTGFAGPVVSPEEFDDQTARALDEARVLVTDAARGLGLEGAAETVVLGGEDPGPSICRLAEERAAAAIVCGTRGRGGLRRAVLGSVSDHLVRHAPCTVVVTGHHDDGPSGGS